MFVYCSKFTPKKGGTPGRNEIVFISPTGEEIRNKRQLDQYPKSHPGGPSISEFDCGTGNTPRRSAKGETAEDKEAATEETKESADREAATETKRSAEEMKDAEVTEGVIADKDTVVDSEQKTEREIDETDMENPEASNEANSDANKEDTGKKSLPMPGLEENNEAEQEAHSQVPVSVGTANPEKEEKTVEDSIPEMADGVVEKESDVDRVGEEDHPDKETLTEKAANVEESKADGDSLEDQVVGKPLENHSMNCEEAPHEPKESQVSC
ncbi:hypothetical protein F0562_001844 [Nyssa sinensis]|uniref:MBD domain-containing protein n=1 Tax=Nyssa sinensis TaxID=561372 RepID=A0A5J5C833_9ASTE|nr:hypothetical protein F0562_001844 [Nyssa sinensis]